MKRLIFFILLIISLKVSAQQTFWTPGVPPGSTSFSPTFRFSGTDSLANLYFSNGSKWWLAYTAAQQNKKFNFNLKWFNVKDYGAIGNGVHDDRDGIQAAQNAAYSNGGGIVYFPNGTYLVHGGLVNSGGTGIGSPNSQLYIKYEASFTGVNGSIPIVWMGEEMPSPNASALANYTINKKGVIIYSDITGSGTLPSVLGSAFSSSTGNLNIASLTIKNINFRVKANIGASGPTMSALNLSNVAFADVDHVVCDIDTSSNLSVSPTAETFGIYMPKINNGAWCPINNVLVTGYKYGVILTEHSTGDNINAIVCENAFVFPGGYHGLQFGRISAYWCKNSISGPTGTIESFSTTGQADSYLNIAQLDIEWQASGTGNWFDRNFIINDASNNLRGHIYYHTVQRGSGAINTGFNKSGGINLYSDKSDGSTLFTGAVEANTVVAPVMVGSGTTGTDLQLQSNNAPSGAHRITFGPSFNSALDDQHGRFGAGTTDPAAAFHSSGTGGESKGFMVQTTSASSYGAGMTFRDDANTTWAQLVGTNGSFSGAPLAAYDLALANYNASGKVSLITYYSLPVRIVTNSLERFTVTGGGNWALNTTSGAANQVPMSNGTTMGWYDISGLGTGSVTSITPGIGFTFHTPITSSGTMDIDTANIGTLSINKNLYDIPNKTTARANLSVYSIAQTNSAIATVASTIPLGANPTGVAGINAINGTSLTWMRSDAAPQIDSTSSGFKTNASATTDRNNLITRINASVPLSGGTSTGLQQIQLTTQQLSLNYDGTNKTAFTTSSTGQLTIAPTGTLVNITGSATVSANLTAGTNTSSFYVPGGTTAVSQSVSQYQYASSSNNYIRTGIYGGTSTSIATTRNYSTFIAGSSPITLASGVTVPWATSIVANTLGTVTNGGGGATITNTASLYVEAPSAAGTNNYSAYINGKTAVNGDVSLLTAGNGLKITEGTNGRVGQVALVAGTKAITISGVTTSSRAFVTLVSPSSASLTIQYQAVCTANTLTIQGNIAAGTINAADVSTINYFIIN